MRGQTEGASQPNREPDVNVDGWRVSPCGAALGLKYDRGAKPHRVHGECPWGFYLDEALEKLGTKLHLPPWFEDQREAIVARLEPITVPEENRPRPGTTSAPRPVVAANPTPALIQ
jgi:hypothetical protein